LIHQEKLLKWNNLSQSNDYSDASVYSLVLSSLLDIHFPLSTKYMNSN